MRVLPVFVSSCNIIFTFLFFFTANNTTHPVIINSNDEVRLVTNTISYQEESVKPLHNFNKKSEFNLSTFRNPSYMIEDEPIDHIDKPIVNNSTLELVCVAPQFSNVINSASFSVKVEEKEKDSRINKGTDNDSITEAKINEDSDNKCNYVFCFPRLLCF